MHKESFVVGDYGEAARGPGDTPLAVRQHLDKAADRRGWWLRWVDRPARVCAMTRQNGANNG